MRAENELIDNVNVHNRAIKAAERVGTNGRLHDIGHVPQTTTRKWFEYLFPHEEKLLVSGREVRGFVLPHWAAGVLLAAILSSMGFMYSRLSDQRDMLIRLDTQLQERDKHELEYRTEVKRNQELQQVYINDLNKQVVALKVVLTPQQVRVLRAQRQDNQHGRHSLQSQNHTRRG